MFSRTVCDGGPSATVFPLRVDQTYHGLFRLPCRPAVRAKSEKVVPLAFPFTAMPVESPYSWKPPPGLRHVEHGVMGIVGMDGADPVDTSNAMPSSSCSRVATFQFGPCCLSCGIRIPVLHQFGIQSRRRLRQFKSLKNTPIRFSLMGFPLPFVHGNPRIDRLQSRQPGPRRARHASPPLGIEGMNGHMPWRSMPPICRRILSGPYPTIVLSPICTVSSHRHTPVFHGKLALFRGHEIFGVSILSGRWTKHSPIALPSGSKSQKQCNLPSCRSCIRRGLYTCIFQAPKSHRIKTIPSATSCQCFPVRAQTNCMPRRPVVVGRGIREDINGIGLCRPYGTWQSLHEAKCHKRFQGYSYLRSI